MYIYTYVKYRCIYLHVYVIETEREAKKYLIRGGGVAGLEVRDSGHPVGARALHEAPDVC